MRSLDRRGDCRRRASPICARCWPWRRSCFEARWPPPPAAPGDGADAHAPASSIAQERSRGEDIGPMADAVQKVRVLLRVNGTASGVTAKIDPESIQHMQFVEKWRPPNCSSPRCGKCVLLRAREVLLILISKWRESCTAWDPLKPIEWAPSKLWEGRGGGSPGCDSGLL